MEATTTLILVSELGNMENDTLLCRVEIGR